MSVSTKSFGSALANTIVGHPWKILAATLLVCAALVQGLGRLTQDYSYRSWFRPDDALLAEFDHFERQFGNDDAMLIAVHSPNGIFDGDSATLIRELTEELKQTERVQRVESIANFPWVHARGDEIVVEPLLPEHGELGAELLAERRAVAMDNPQLPGQLISADGTTALVVGYLKPELEAAVPDYKGVVTAVSALVAKYAGRGDNTLHLGGFPALTDQFRASAEEDVGTLFPLVFLAIGLVLALGFRRFGSVPLPLITVLFSLLAALGIAAFAGFGLNNLTAATPHIVLAVGLSDAIHILASFYRFRRGGLQRREAARQSLEQNFLPTLGTCATTAVGFWSFAFSDVPPIAGLGIIAGIGCCTAWVLSFLLLGPLLVLLPSRAGARPGHEAPQAPFTLATRLTAFLEQNRVALVGGTALAVVVAAAAATRLRVDSDPFRYFGPDVPLTQATELIEESMGAAVAVEVVVDSGKPDGVTDPSFLQKVDAFQQRIGEFEFVTKTYSIVDTIKEMNRVLHGGNPEFARIPADEATLAQLLLLYRMGMPPGQSINNRISTKDDALRISLLWSERSSAKTLAKIAAVKDEAKQLGLDVGVTGKFTLSAALNPRVVNTFTRSMAIALVFVPLMLVLFLRSIRIGLLGLIPNVLPIVLGLGTLSLFSTTLDAGTAVMGSVVLGIAVDDTMHFLVAYHEARKTGSPQAAVAQVLSRVGPALVMTTIVLVLGFGVLSLSSYIPNRNFGLMVAITLAYALVMDLVLLPTLLLWRARRSPSPSPLVAMSRANQG